MGGKDISTPLVAAPPSLPNSGSSSASKPTSWAPKPCSRDCLTSMARRGVVAAEHDHVDLGLLHLVDQRGEVLVGVVVGLVHGRLDAALRQRLHGLVGDALAVGRLVVEDRDLGVLVVLDDVGPDRRALHVVAAAGAEHRGVALGGRVVGQLDVGRGRRDLQDLGFLVDVRRRDRAARAVVAGHEDDLVGDHLVGDGRRLLGIAGIVADLQHELLAVHAAGGVDVLDRHLGAALHLLAEGGILAGHRPDRGDLDLRKSRCRRRRWQPRQACRKSLFMQGLPWFPSTTVEICVELSAAPPSPASLCAR